MPSLRDLGLSEYEARSYRSLLRTGPTTAKELSRTSEVPMGRIYDVLNSLEQHNLVRSQAAGRPKKYVAVEPEVALDRLLEAKQRELDAQARQYEEVVDSLVEEIDATGPVDEQFWTAAVGPGETLELLLERIAAAEEELIYVAGSPGSGIDLRSATDRVAEKLQAALDRGVDVDLLVTPEVVDNLSERSVSRYHDRLDEYGRFAVRTLDDVDGTFMLVDRVEVCIEVPNPLDPTEAFAMIDLKDDAFAADVREEFAPRWDRADAFDPAVESK
ncbi:MAG: helix-turn-helix domain-containing protein [Halohasta sp.]